MNTTAALLTKHEKYALIAPALAQAGIVLVATDQFDTDTLGTFSGEIPRQLSPLECAREKARLALSLTGLPIGIGSEGTFGGGPLPGMMNWDTELLVLLDHTTGQEIVAQAAGPIALSALESADLAAIEAHILRHDPAQGWMLRVGETVQKGLIGFSAITKSLFAAGRITATAQLTESVLLQPDYRAHLCPARQHYIRQAAEQLAARYVALCPQCQTPNFWRGQAVAGLPCETCAYPTSAVHYYHKCCQQCGYTEQEPAATATASAAHCPLCNP